MGTSNSVLQCSTRYPWLPEVECTSGSVPYGSFASNPAITGIGVSFCNKLLIKRRKLTCIRLLLADRHLLRLNSRTLPLRLRMRPTGLRPSSIPQMETVLRASRYKFQRPANCSRSLYVHRDPLHICSLYH